MDWIKKNFDQFALAAFSLILLAASAFIIMKSLSYGETFSATASSPPPNNTVKPLDLAPINEAVAAAGKPAQWSPKGSAGAKTAGSLFVAKKTILKDGKPEAVTDEGMTFPPVPNAYLAKYNLSLVNPAVLTDDPDKDGFSTLKEFLGANHQADGTGDRAGDPDSTNPVDAKSFPPYHTQLFFKEWIRVRFRLLFSSYNGDIKKPATMDFQINPLELNQGTQFVKLGALVPGTKYRVEKFDYKGVVNPATGAETDVSELTLVNTETNEPVVLVLEKVADSPESFAHFVYNWPQPPQEFRVAKFKEFTLKPNVAEKYKLIDIKEAEALIALPSGEKYTVPRQP